LSGLGAVHRLAPPAASVSDAIPRIASSGLEAVLLLAAPAAPVRTAVPSVAQSGLGAVHRLTPPAASMPLAVPGVALSGLGAVHRLAPPAPAVSDAVGRAACSSGLGAALLLAPFAPAMSSAVRRATISNPLGAALQLTLPPAHGPPLSSLHVDAAETKSAALRPIHSRHPPPLSPQRSISAHRTQQTRRWQGESRSGVAACRAKMVNSAWAGDVRWVCSRAGWTGTPPQPQTPGSQAACTSCRFSKP
jgi:hypothetical protein